MGLERMSLSRRLSAKFTPPSRQEAASSMAPVMLTLLRREALALQARTMPTLISSIPSASTTAREMATEAEDELLSPTPMGMSDRTSIDPRYFPGSSFDAISVCLTTSAGRLYSTGSPFTIAFQVPLPSLISTLPAVVRETLAVAPFPPAIALTMLIAPKLNAPPFSARSSSSQVSLFPSPVGVASILSIARTRPLPGQVAFHTH